MHTHLRCVSVWARLTSSERSRLGLKRAYQPEPCVIYSELTSSAFACAHSSVEGSESDGGRTSFSDSAGAASLSFCLVRCCSIFRLRTSEYSEKTMLMRCGYPQRSLPRTSSRSTSSKLPEVRMTSHPTDHGTHAKNIGLTVIHRLTYFMTSSNASEMPNVSCSV